MIPLVNWLNTSFGDLTTEYCCQGTGQGKDAPYVLLRCFDWDQLKKLAWHLRWHGLHMEVFVASPEHPYPRFRIDFQSQGKLKEFVQKETRRS